MKRRLLLLSITLSLLLLAACGKEAEKAEPAPGTPAASPANSDYLAAGGTAVIENIINGLSGPITVNGEDYKSVMPPMAYINDADVADIVNFVMNSWGNPGGSFTAEDVANVCAR